MLFHLLYPLHTEFSLLNVVQYITFRTAAASLTAFVVSLVCGPFTIRKLRELQIGQIIRDDGPPTHHGKAGTPTMGGLLLLGAAFLPTLLWADLTNVYVQIALLSTAAFGAIGFLDDWLKISRRSHRGLSARGKLVAQGAVATAVGAALLQLTHSGLYSSEIIFPFFKQFTPDIGWLYVPFAVLVLVSASNAVNLTDGLDGLAISVFTVAARRIHGADLRERARGHRGVPAAGALSARGRELTIFCGALVGAGLGFLWYNSYPADVFMGDVGALAPRRRARDRRPAHQAGAVAADRRRGVRDRGAVGDPPGRFVQAHGPARVPDGAPAPPLRADRVERAEDHHPVPDRGGGLCVVQPDDPETAMSRFSVADSRVVVVGAGRSGIAAARLLAGRGARVTLSEAGAEIAGTSEGTLVDAGVRIEVGGPPGRHAAHRGPPGAESGGVPAAAGDRRRAPSRGPGHQRSGAGVALVAGPSGGRDGNEGKKSTTVVVTARMLEAGGCRAVVGGNIGVALSSQVEDSTPDAVHVVEVSSFQLELTETFRPWIAVCLNLSPDHLDRHASFEEYAGAKARVFANQTPDDAMVINADDPHVLAIARAGRARALRFAVDTRVAEGVQVTADGIAHRSAGGERCLVPMSAVRVPGRHLLGDMAAAAAVGMLAGVDASAMTRAVQSFTGLEHTLELVTEIDGVRFVNDSKATNVVAARAAVECFGPGLVVILGGRFKGGAVRGSAVPAGVAARVGRRHRRGAGTRTAGPGVGGRGVRGGNDGRGGAASGRARTSRRRRAPGAGVRQPRHVSRLRRPGCGVQERGGGCRGLPPVVAVQDRA